MGAEAEEEVSPHGEEDGGSFVSDMAPMGMAAAKFPHVDNGGKAKLSDGKLTFSYVDTRSRPRTDTKPVLTAKQIVAKVQARMERFNSAPMGARESDKSRSERKHIAAHATNNVDALRAAWKLMNEDQRMEFEMMLSSVSHSGISKLGEIADSKPTRGPVGDDGKSLDAEGVRDKKQYAHLAKAMG